AARIREGGVPAEDADGAITPSPPGILEVHVIDALAERVDELDVVDALVAEVRRVEVEPEAPVATDRFDRALSGRDVEGDLRRMDLEPEVDVHSIERVEDRLETSREVIEASLPILLRRRRKRVDRMPDARPREAVDDGGKLLASGAGVDEPPTRLPRPDHLLGGTLADAFRIAIAPDVGRKDQFVPLVDRIADRLPDQMVRDRVRGEAVPLEDLPAPFAIGVVRERLIDVEMIAPAGELEAVVTKVRGLLAHGFERKIRPLSGEKRDGSRHDFPPP